MRGSEERVPIPAQKSGPVSGVSVEDERNVAYALARPSCQGRARRDKEWAHDVAFAVLEIIARQAPFLLRRHVCCLQRGKMGSYDAFALAASVERNSRLKPWSWPAATGPAFPLTAEVSRDQHPLWGRHEDGHHGRLRSYPELEAQTRLAAQPSLLTLGAGVVL
jgi:hypothetical protein